MDTPDAGVLQKLIGLDNQPAIYWEKRLIVHVTIHGLEIGRSGLQFKVSPSHSDGLVKARASWHSGGTWENLRFYAPDLLSLSGHISWRVFFNHEVIDDVIAIAGRAYIDSRYEDILEKVSRYLRMSIMDNGGRPVLWPDPMTAIVGEKVP